MSILNNAVNSIRIGIEDYSNKEEGRDKTAIRNIYSGLLLLYKEKLLQLSPDYEPELFIKSKILPFIDPRSRDILFKGKGRKTVSYLEIEERFKELNIKIDFGRFKKINELRNDLEHYYTDAAPEVIREIVASSFVLIKDFMEKELEEDPLELIGANAWKEMLKISEIYDTEKKECEASFLSIEWGHQLIKEFSSKLRCTECHTELILATNGANFPETDFECRGCKNRFSCDDVFPSIISEHFGYDSYVANQEGEAPPLESCPECFLETFLVSENVCLMCCYELEYSNCIICNAELDVGEQHYEGYCSYCDHMMSRD